MAEIKFTKSELRLQQNRLGQLQKYLPTLQLKKAMLQSEVNEARLEIAQLETQYHRQHAAAEAYSALLSDLSDFDATQAAKIKIINKRYENIAGVEVPYFESVSFEPFSYNLFTTPAWADAVVAGLRNVIEARAMITVVEEKKER